MLPPMQHPAVTFGTLLAEVAVSELLHGAGFEGSPWNPPTAESPTGEVAPGRGPATWPTSRDLQTRARLVRT